MNSWDLNPPDAIYLDNFKIDYDFLTYLKTNLKSYGSLPKELKKK